MTFICIGRKVPKEIEDLGWVERSAMHLGNGAWIISLEKLQHDRKGFDRNKYQREYMRLRRAAEKLKKSHLQKDEV